MNIIPTLISAFVLGGCVGWNSAAYAQASGENLGTLTCTVADQSNEPANEKRAIRCGYRPAATAVDEYYTGTISRTGGQPFPDAKLVLIWVVRAPAGIDPAPGFLSQTYIGRPSDHHNQSVVLLVGQSDRQIILQSLTKTGEPGASFITILDLELKSAPA